MATTPDVLAVGTTATCIVAKTVAPVVPASVVDGDLLLMWLAAIGGTFTPPAGWTLEVNKTQGGSPFACALLYSKPGVVADAGATQTVDLGSFDTVAAAGILRIGPVKRSGTVRATSSSGSASATQAPTAPTVGDGNTLTVGLWSATNDGVEDVGNTWSQGFGTTCVSLAGDGPGANFNMAVLVTSDTSSPGTARSATCSASPAVAAAVLAVIGGAGGQMMVI